MPLRPVTFSRSAFCKNALTAPHVLRTGPILSGAAGWAARSCTGGAGPHAVGLWAAGEEAADCAVDLPRALELGHVAAVELDVGGLGEPLADMAREADRHERVATAPDEQRLGRERLETLPEPRGILEVDVARRGVERHAPARAEVRAHELV